MMLFPKFLFLATNFPKIDKNSIFQLNFHQNFSKFSQIFPKQLCFSCKRAKIKRMVLKFFCKIGENTTFFAIFLRNFLQIFENSPASGGLRLPDPLRGWTPYLEPPRNFFLRTPLITYKLSFFGNFEFLI